MKLLLDMYRSAPKEQRDKVQLMAAEKKSKSEVTNQAQSQSMQSIRGVSQIHDTQRPRCSELLFVLC